MENKELIKKLKKEQLVGGYMQLMVTGRQACRSALSVEL